MADGDGSREVLLGCAGSSLVLVGVFAGLCFGFLYVAAHLGDPPDMGGEPTPQYALDGVEVSIEPSTGLAEGATVRVSSTAFRPLGTVEVVPCSVDPGGELDQCDDDLAVHHAVPADGRLAVDVVVPRVLTLGSDRVVDCGEVDTPCALIAADTTDRGVSGGTLVAFRDDLAPLVPEPAEDPLPLTPATATLEPPSPVPDGDPVTVVAPGFVPGEPVTMGACESVPELPGSLGRCAALVGDDFFFDDDGTVPSEGPVAGPDGVARIEVYLSARIDGRGRSGDVDCLGPGRGCVIAVRAVAEPRRVAVVPVQVLR